MGTSIVNVRIAFQDVPTSTNVKDDSWLLSSAIAFEDNTCLAFADFHLSDPPTLNIFEDITSKGGSYTLELGAVLPNLLPNLNGKADYWLDVAVDETSKIRVCVSNQMLRLRFIANSHFVYCILPRSSTLGRKYAEGIV